MVFAAHFLDCEKAACALDLKTITAEVHVCTSTVIEQTALRVRVKSCTVLALRLSMQHAAQL